MLNIRLFVRSLHRSAHRLKLTTVELDSATMAQVLQPSVVRFGEAFRNRSEVRLVGGAVRDVLRGEVPRDWDFATTATPAEMKEIFGQAGIPITDTFGEKYGSIKTRIGADSFNCTTLRVDKVTDGRYAVVDFVTDWEVDSFRRDFTVNAMYLNLAGTLFDYHDGYKHSQTASLRFVGEPDERIKEDYLRILRYFRFYGRIARHQDDHDPEIIAAVVRNAEGLAKLTGARIWTEVKQIVVGNYAADILSKMLQCGLMPYLNLPSSFDVDSCSALLERCRNVSICPTTLNPVTIIAAGLSDVTEAYTFLARSKSTKLEREILIFLLQNRNLFMNTSTHTLLEKPHDEFLRLAKHFLYEGQSEESTLIKISELLTYCGLNDTLNDLQAWQIPEFPVDMSHLAFIEEFKTRVKVKKILVFLWGESDHKMTREELIGEVDNVLTNLKLR